jgi:hypothetical protein
MFQCWLYCKQMFVPSIGRRAKILFSDIRDASIHQWLHQRLPNFDPWRLRPFSCKRYFRYIVHNRSLLALVMTPSYRTYLLTIHVHHILSYMFRILQHSLFHGFQPKSCMHAPHSCDALSKPTVSHPCWTLLHNKSKAVTETYLKCYRLYYFLKPI